jgi:hypothetical protein
MRQIMAEKISKSQYEELKRKADLADSLQVQVNNLTKSNGAAGNTNTAASESDETKKLREELETRKANERKANIAAAKTEFEKFAAEEVVRQNKDHLKGKLGKFALEEIVKTVEAMITEERLDGALKDPVDGKPSLKMWIKGEVNKTLKEKLKVIEEAEASVMRTQITNSVVDPSIRINALGAAGREIGSLKEEAYGSDSAGNAFDIKNRVRDILLSKIFKMPVVRPDGRHVLEEFKPMLHEMISLQQAYEEMMGVGDHHMFSPGGRIHSILNSPMAKQNICKLMEADEATTTYMVGGTGIANLPVDASAAIIMATWPRLIAQRVAATTGTMMSNTARIYDLQYPHSDIDPFNTGQHFFGAVDADNPATLETTFTLTTSGVVANDEGALVRASNHYPQDVFGLLGEVVLGADAVITITGTDQNGDSATATATFLLTDTVGTVRIFVPTVLGTKFMDVTAVTSSGWNNAAGAGEVGIFTPDPIIGHVAGSPAQKARFKLTPYDVTESQYDKQSNMPLAVIEDMMKALSAGGGPGLNLVATTIRLLSNEFLNLIDQAIIDQGVQNAYANNQITFDTTTPAAGFSIAEWREQVHFNFDTVCATVEHFSSARPNWMIAHSLDIPHITEWLKGTGFMTTFDPLVNDPFADSRAQYRLVGCDVYKSANGRLKRVLFGSNNQDTGVHYLVYVPFQVLQGQNPTAGFETVVMLHHRAFIGVPTKTGVPSTGQKSLGVLKITR